MFSTFSGLWEVVKTAHTSTASFSPDTCTRLSPRSSLRSPLDPASGHLPSVGLINISASAVRGPPVSGSSAAGSSRALGLLYCILGLLSLRNGVASQPVPRAHLHA